MIGVLASLSEEQYQILEKLQMNIQKVSKAVGVFIHWQWRSFISIGHATATRYATANIYAKTFLDSELIESLLNLDRNQKEEIASAMEIPL